MSKKKYKAKVIPVGEDQRQHLEYTRDIVSEFNKVTKGLSKEYENFFPMPQVHYSKFFYYILLNLLRLNSFCYFSKGKESYGFNKCKIKNE